MPYAPKWEQQERERKSLMKVMAEIRLTTRSYMAENRNLQSHRRENLSPSLHPKTIFVNHIFKYVSHDKNW
jgi:hypothetical protein